MKCRGIVGVLVAVAIFVILPFALRVEAETVAWTGVTQYTDGSPIPTAKQSQLSYAIEYRIPPGSFTPFGTATGGATSFVAPYVTQGGVTSYWRMQTISVADNNSRSVWSPEVAFTRPFQVPVVPAPITVQ